MGRLFRGNFIAKHIYKDRSTLFSSPEPKVRPLIGWDIFYFSSETAEQNSTKLDRKQDLNILYQVCVFQANLKNKMAASVSDWLRHFRLLFWKQRMEFNETWQEVRSQCPLPSFSAPEPKAQVHYCDHALSVIHPSSVVVNFSHFWLLLWNRWTEFNETWQEARSQRPLPSLCFLGRSEKQDGPPASDWLRHFRLLLWNCWTKFSEIWKEARSQCPLPSLYFSGRSEKQDGRPGLWLAETFSTSPLKPLNGIQRNLIGSKISTSSTKFKFFRPIRKTRWLPQPLIGWDIFDFFSETAKRNSTKLDSKQDLNVLYQVCVFWGWSEKQDDPPGQSVQKGAHCTQVHDMWPFGPVVVF